MSSKHFSLFMALFLLSISATADDDTLTKALAFEAMKANGYKWKQTETLPDQATALTSEAQALLEPHLMVYSREQGGRLNPIQLGFNTPGNINYYTFGATVLSGSYALYDRSALERLNAAQVNEKSSQALKEQYELDLTYVMLAQYLNCQRLRKKLELTANNLEKSLELLNLAKAKVDAGVGISLDLKRAQGLVEFQNLKKTDTETAYNKAKLDLATTLGWMELKGNVPPLTYTKFEKTPSLVVPTDRPDKRYAELNSELAEALKKQVQGERFIKVELFSDLGVVGTQLVGGENQAVTGFLGVQISLPIFDGHLIAAQEQAADVRITQSRLQAEQVQLESTAQLKIALDQMRDSDKAVETSNRQISISREELQIAERRFRAGVSSGLELASAQSSLSTASDGNLDAIFGYELAKLNYYRAMGSFDEYLNLGGGHP